MHGCTRACVFACARAFRGACVSVRSAMPPALALQRAACAPLNTQAAVEDAQQYAAEAEAQRCVPSPKAGLAHPSACLHW